MRQVRSLSIVVAAAIGLVVIAAALFPPFRHAGIAAPIPPHVMIVLMENTSYEGVVGNSQMPFVNGLVNANGSVSTTDLSHPSLPNYLGLVSGSIQNNPQDTTPQDGTYAGPQLTDELAAAVSPGRHICRTCRQRAT